MEKTKRFKIESGAKSFIEKVVKDCLSIEKVDYELIDIVVAVRDTTLFYNNEPLGRLRIELDYQSLELMLTFNKFRKA